MTAHDDIQPEDISDAEAFDAPSTLEMFLRRVVSDCVNGSSEPDPETEGELYGAWMAGEPSLWGIEEPT